MKEKPAVDHFADVRGRLSRMWRKQDVDQWLAKEHQGLGMRSPARAIHSGQAAAVHALIDTIEKIRG